MVGRQPFGGNRLSGTGPKAGGPDYLLQFVEAARRDRGHHAPRPRGLSDASLQEIVDGAERPARPARSSSTTASCARSPTAPSSASSTRCAPRASSAARRRSGRARCCSATASARRPSPCTSRPTTRTRWKRGCASRSCAGCAGSATCGCSKAKPVAEDELELARASAADAAAILQSEADTQLDRRRREQELLAALLAGDPAAASQLEADRYLPQRPLVVCAGEVEDLRIPAKHALFGAGVAIIPAHLAEALSGPVGVGDAIDDLRDAPRSHRHALAALEVADGTVTKWDDLRAQRLLSALPPTALGDLPDGVRALLDNEQLSHTLETFLDHAGDVKRTAAELWLHRTSLYYRLRRIEEIAGVDLNRGEDRLLCHVALRLAQRP